MALIVSHAKIIKKGWSARFFHFPANQPFQAKEIFILLL